MSNIRHPSLKEVRGLLYLLPLFCFAELHANTSFPVTVSDPPVSIDEKTTSEGKLLVASSKEFKLNEEEIRWIESNGEVKFTGDPNWLPYEAFQDDGSYIGIVAEHLDIVEKKTGLKIKPIPVASWEESLKIATEGKVDIISGDSADAILNKRFNPIDAYSHNPIVIIMGSQQHYVESLEEIKHLKIAIIKDYGYTADIFKYYPGFEFVEVKNIQEGLEGVSLKRYDAMLATMALASYTMAELGLHNIKVVGKTPIIMDLTLFVSKDQPVLHSIINKALKSIPATDTQKILQGWIRSKYVEKTDYTVLMQVSISLLVMIAVVLIWNRSRLQKEIANRRNIEQSLIESQTLLREAQAMVHIGNWEIDPNTFNATWSDEVYRILGYDVSDSSDLTLLTSRFHPADREAATAFLQNALAGQDDYQMECRIVRPDGELLWIECHCEQRRNESGELVLLRGVIQDVTERKRQEEHIVQQAHFDALTQLPNRFLSLDRLSQLITEAHRKHEMVAVLFLDLDDFKKINDTLGHDAGDKLLIEAARRLEGSVREGDTVGRLGGDEFIVLLRDLSGAIDAQPVVENMLARFRDAFRIDSRDLILTASIGIAVYPDDGDTPHELLRKADSAMYHSKEQGRNTYSYFTEAMNEGVSRRLFVEEQMHGALDRGQFRLCYQPKIDIGSGKVLGVEALLRWNNPALGEVAPDEFIPIAEQTGLIVPIGQFVITEALRMNAHWTEKFGAAFSVAINLSPRQFRDPSLVGFIKESMLKNCTLNSCLELEITEGVLMSGHSYISDSLAAIGKAGISIAMDDFGTGYSSLSYLRNFPFDVLKIDRSFINDITSDKADLELVVAAIGMAHALGMKVVAEGVETEAQLSLLAAQGCDIAQGYYFSQPVSADEITAMCTRQCREHEVTL